MGFGFTFKSKSINDNFLFHFNFLFICYKIQLLIINSNLSMPFKFLSGMCHPTIEAPKSLNNSQSKKEKKNLNLPNNINCHHCL